MIDQDRRGFTLIEMLIVVVIVAILGAIAYGRFNRPSLSALVVPDSVVAPQATGRLVVQVENAFGWPKRGVSVVFRVVEGSAAISPEVVETDSAGTAGAQWVAGSIAGLNTFAASVGDTDWDRMQMTVTVRVDPSRGPASPAPGMPGSGTSGGDTAPADSAAGPGEGAGTGGASTPPTPPERRPMPRDSARGGPSGDGDEAGSSADSVTLRVPWSSAPVWALRLLEPAMAVAED